MNEKCADCLKVIVFDPFVKRVSIECPICERTLCIKCGLLEKAGQRLRLPCRRCKSSEALEGGVA
jgi:hypothetical protein